MTWNKALPTAPGFYWMRSGNRVAVVEVRLCGETLVVPGANGSGTRTLPMFCAAHKASRISGTDWRPWWAGPITQPPP